MYEIVMTATCNRTYYHKVKIAHYRYLILHNREFRSFGNRKNYFKSINVIGDRLIAESGDSKSKKFLFERISLAIQRGNAASIRDTFPDSALLSEIFAL
jgi:hypothetical protein